MSDIVARLRILADETTAWSAVEEETVKHALPALLQVVEVAQEYATHEDLTLNPCPMCSPDDPEQYRAARVALYQALCPLKAK